MTRLALPAATPWVGMLLNGLLFNVSWLVIVLGESTVIGVGQVVLHLALHFYLLGYGLKELWLVALVAAGGFLLDKVLFLAGVFTLGGEAATTPLWMHCLWPVFATTLCHAFAGFARRPLVAALVGGTSAALSYVAGVRLTAVEFGDPLLSPIVIGLLWAVLFPLLLRGASVFVPYDSRA